MDLQTLQNIYVITWREKGCKEDKIKTEFFWFSRAMLNVIHGGGIEKVWWENSIFHILFNCSSRNDKENRKFQAPSTYFPIFLCCIVSVGHIHNKTTRNIFLKRFGLFLLLRHLAFLSLSMFFFYFWKSFVALLKDCLPNNNKNLEKNFFISCFSFSFVCISYSLFITIGKVNLFSHFIYFP